MLTKLKGFCKRNKKRLIISYVSAMMLVASAMTCFAAEAGDAVASSDSMTQMLQEFLTSMTSLQDDLILFIVSCIPVGLTIFGAVVCITKAISFVKKLLGKAS